MLPSFACYVEFMKGNLFEYVNRFWDKKNCFLVLFKATLFQYLGIYYRIKQMKYYRGRYANEQQMDPLFSQKLHR